MYTSMMSTNNEDVGMQLHVESNLLISKHRGEECEHDPITTFLDIHMH
jgi:hypothetical protein